MLDTLEFKKLTPTAIIPTRAHPGDAGLDLYADECTWLNRDGLVKVRTGIAVDIPHGYVGLVHPRSGLAARHAVTVVNAPGTIDSGYHGEIIVILTQLPAAKYLSGNFGFIEPGDRIAQLVIQEVELPRPIEVSAFSTDTERGDSGLGSTGR